MMRLALAGLCLLALSTAASAATVDLRITGVVSSQDDLGDLVWGGTAEAGAEFEAVYTFDTTGGVPETLTDGTGRVDNFIYGGSDFFTGAHLTGSLRIGNTTESFVGDIQSTVALIGAGNTAPDTGFIRYQIMNSVNGGGLAFTRWLSFDIFDVLANAFNIPSTFDTPYDVSDPEVLINGYAYISNGNFDSGGFAFDTYAYTTLTGTRAVLTVRSPDTDPSPVPLPASALMLGAAVGAIGALRRKRRLA